MTNKELATGLMQSRFLNAVWQYHRDKSSNPADVKISKAVFLLVGAGCFTEAAALANTQPVVAEIWQMALN